MAHKLKVPIHFAQLKFISGDTFLLPLNDLDAYKVNVEASQVAKRYAADFQEHRLDNGSYISLLNEVSNKKYIPKSLTVAFPKSKNRINFPAFSIDFTYLQCPWANGFSGVVPVLGIESYGITEEDLEKQISESIKLEFSRERRMEHVQNIVETLWFEDIKVLKEEMEVEIYSLAEIEEKSQQQAQRLLPDVAKKMNVNQPALFGGEKWLNLFSRSINSNFGRSILLLGPSGVGKTTLVREAVRQQQKLGFSGTVWETTASTLIKELTKETGWQDQLASLAKELAETGDILFIRNLADLFEVGQYAGNSMSIAEYLRGFISRGEMVLISECTPEEAARIELKAPNFLSFFSILQMQEPKGEELKDIILKKILSLSDIEEIEVKKEAIEEIIRLHLRFMPYSGFPGKPIRFIESILIQQKAKDKNKFKLELSRAEIIKAFSIESGMPLFIIDPDVKMDVSSIKDRFNRQVYGQELAVNQVTNMLATVKTALTRRNKPIASFLFVGPTGVGKTELGKVLAEFMFGKREKLIRFDMSEFSNYGEVLRLIGIGTADGLLTSAVRREPFSVILFDEIEKAADNFYDLLLQVLSEGRLSDAQGKTVNFCSTIIIMTSNIGAASFQNAPIGWSSQQNTEDIKSHFESSIEKHFRPELYNRIDRIIPFAPLSEKTVRHIVEREMQLLIKREGIHFRNMEFKVSKEALDYLAILGYDAKYGARHLQRAIRQKLVVPLSSRLNDYPWDDQLIVDIKVAENELVINIEDDPLGLDLLLEELEKINNSDLTADLRRSLDALFDSFTWLRFMDEMTLLEEKKEEKGEGFWIDGNSVSKYNNYILLKERIMNLQAEIEEMELDLGLVCLELKQYSPKINDKIEAWQKRLFEFKIDIISTLYPERNQCNLAIYGSAEHIEKVFKIYSNTLTNRGFVVKGKTVWFRSKYYNEEVLAEDFSSDDNEETSLIRRPRKEYIYSNLEKGFSKPPLKNDVLWGVELTIQGSCAFTYLQHEKDLQQWYIGDNVYSYVLKIEEGNKLITPEGIHRKDFYKMPARRTIKQDILKDTRYKIEREINNLEAFIGEILEELFVLAVGEEV